MNLSGTLSDWTVADLLNVMKVTGKTASLHVHGRRDGVVHFSSGRVVGAALDGNPIPSGEFESRAAASDTLYVLSALTEGTFEVGPFEGSEEEGWDVDALLVDMQQLDGLEADLVEAGLRDSMLMLRDEIKEPITIQVEDWWAMASLVSVLSFDQLEEVFGRGRAIRLLHALWRMDLMETVPEEGPVADDELNPDNELIPASELSEPEEEPVPMVVDQEPASLDLSQLSDHEETEEDNTPAIEPVEERDDESWLDEIAAAADTNPDKPELAQSRQVLGVSAPASTVLTGAVLDEMRRLRVRPTE